ncbi:hypothetical protein [Vibrio sp. SCSIO 43136]|uniref:hypothetical protein n=1 Tax=Vibrio sp. SCSIO 43136 TaxID=2819101 RepID=UPI0020757DEE|nr:hypothetical protein [Vibrio sp. SCSIO 43136]USD65719.1 hypothetical protein J4N39_02505 [Vibrio sp. SCSIO 43136]
MRRKHFLGVIPHLSLYGWLFMLVGVENCPIFAAYTVDKSLDILGASETILQFWLAKFQRKVTLID